MVVLVEVRHYSNILAEQQIDSGSHQPSDDYLSILIEPNGTPIGKRMTRSVSYHALTVDGFCA